MSDEGEAPRTSPIMIAFLLLAAIAAAALVYEALNPASPVYCWFHKCRCLHAGCHTGGGEGGEGGGGGGGGDEDNGSGTPPPGRTLPQLHSLRHSAWVNDDFWAQLELGQIYNDVGKNDYDPVEAYVWYFLASINPQARFDGDELDSNGRYAYRQVYQARIDAKHERARIAELFTSDQRDWARDRIIYVLACRGPAGFALLGELYSPWSPVSGDADQDSSSSGGSGGGGLSRTDDRGGYDFDSESVKPIARNEHDAMLYYDLAERSGNGLSTRYREYAKNFASFLDDYYSPDVDHARAIVKQASDDAARWHLPFAYYPGPVARNGSPLTDECNSGGDDQYPDEVDDRPISDWTIQQALWALNFLHTPPTKRYLDSNSREMLDAIVAYQRSHGKQATGWLTIHDQLSLLTEAAEHQDPASEIALGKIYVTGSIQSVPEVASGDGEVWWNQVAGDRRANNYYRGMAFYDLASIYKNGYGDVPADEKKWDLFRKYSQDMRFDPHKGPRDLICDPDELAQDREPAAGGDGQ